MAEEKKKMYELVAERIITQLENGTAPWQKPWNSAGTDFVPPYNAVTNNAYKGLNSLYLHMFSPYHDPRWATFKQADSQGWQVNKGAKGFMINYVKTHEQKTVLDASGRPVKDTQGVPLKTAEKLQRPIITTAWVFNAEQITGIPPLPQKEETALALWEKIARVEAIIHASGAAITHVTGDAAFYRPDKDTIQLPERAQFDASDKYYSVLLHELGHWTGHPKRLNRGIMNTFGSPEYAREELRAEIGSMMLGSELRIGRDPCYQIAYVAGWIELLKNTPQEILLAAADAQKISDYILDFEHKLDKKQEIKAATVQATTKPGALVQGDAITYKEAVFSVLEATKKGVLVSTADGGQAIRLSPRDGLYNSLLAAKKNSSPAAPWHQLEPAAEPILQVVSPEVPTHSSIKFKL